MLKTTLYSESPCLQPYELPRRTVAPCPPAAPRDHQEYVALLFWKPRACHLRCDRPARDTYVCHPHTQSTGCSWCIVPTRGRGCWTRRMFLRNLVPYLQKEHTCMLPLRNCMNLLFRSIVKGFSMKYTPFKVPFLFSPNASTMISKHERTILSALGRLRIPMVFAGEYSVQGGEAHTIVNHPIG